LRKLNEQQVIDEQQFWKVMNMSLPILLVLLFGGLMFYYRKRKFSREIT